MESVVSFDQYRMPDEIWERIQKVLSKYKRHRKGGHPRAELRGVANAIFYRLRTGCQWRTIPPSLSPGSTAHDNFKHWVADGMFEKFWQVALEEYDELVGLDWLGKASITR